MNFNRLGLKKLITTHYNMDGSSSYVMTYDGKDPKDDIDFSKGIKIPLKDNGDFRSSECIDLLKQSDMVVTNPPFSMFREFVAQLEKYHKKFIIWGNNNAITYKEIFPLIKEGKLWLGYFANKTCYFKLSPDYSKADLYPKYDNYDAIEIGKVLQIPLDYTGVMGVPITFLGKYSPGQFEIIGLDRYTVPKEKLVGGRLSINRKIKYARILIRNKHPDKVHLNN